MPVNLVPPSRPLSLFVLTLTPNNGNSREACKCRALSFFFEFSPEPFSLNFEAPFDNEPSTLQRPPPCWAGQNLLSLVHSFLIPIPFLSDRLGDSDASPVTILSSSEACLMSFWRRLFQFLPFLEFITFYRCRSPSTCILHSFSRCRNFFFSNLFLFLPNLPPVLAQKNGQRFRPSLRVASSPFFWPPRKGRLTKSLFMYSPLSFFDFARLRSVFFHKDI